MSTPSTAALVVNWGSGKPERIDFQFNPTELNFTKAAQYAEIAIPGLDAPVVQFVRGQAETVTLDLFFDSTEDGVGDSAVSVTKKTDRFYQLVKVVPKLHAPPICTLVWNDEFPGFRVDKRLGDNRRKSFQCVVESVRHKYTLFSTQGVPLRATLTVSLREYRTVDQQYAELNKQSPDRMQVHILQSGETLSAIAGQHYLDPGQWRLIADSNSIEDPRRITPGAFLRLPPNR